MSSRILRITQAVLTALNGASFTQSFTAVRKGIAHYTLAELKESFRVTVLAGPATFETLGRAGDRKTQAIDIVVQRGDLDPNSDSDVDPLIELMEEIAAEFSKKRLTTGDGKAINCGPREFVQPGNAAIHPSHLEDFNTFTGVVRTTWSWLPRSG